MAGFNGAGVYVRSYDWTDDRDAGVKVRADRMDEEMDGFATGLSTCIAKDGQTVLTANIPMAGFKLTGLGAGSAAGNSVRWEQVLGTILTPTQLAANANDYAPSGYATASMMRLSSDAARDITGIDAGVGMGRLVLVNVGSFAITLKDADANSAAANRFAFGADYVLAAGASVSIVYDSTSSRWRLTQQSKAMANVVEDTTPQLGGALDGQGNDLNNLGVVFLTEQAAAEADVAGKGQFWVKTATPNEAWFTDDAGNDHQFANLDQENQPLTGGATVTSKDLGTQSSGTLTLDMGDRPLQHYTNNGAHTLAPGAIAGASIVDITNGASAGAITTSGWTKTAGDSFTTTNGHKFRCHCSVGNGGSLLVVQALQ